MRRVPAKTKTEVFGLFPVPVMRVRGALTKSHVRRLVNHFSPLAMGGKRDKRWAKSYSSTEMLQAKDDPMMAEAAECVQPHLVEFGQLLFGEEIDWAVREMWVNVLEKQGNQRLHNHANSFASGVIYLTATHPDSRTEFRRSVTGTDFYFKNNHPGVKHGPFNMERWVSPKAAAGDLLLFPSYLMHFVPPNVGERRITMAFNAVPKRLNAWGYTVTLG